MHPTQRTVYLLAILLLIEAIASEIYMVKVIIEEIHIQYFVKTTGFILKSTDTELKYEYSIEEQVYNGNQESYWDNSTSYAEKYREEDQVSVYYDPKNPETAYLTREVFSDDLRLVLPLFFLHLLAYFYGRIAIQGYSKLSQSVLPEEILDFGQCVQLRYVRWWFPDYFLMFFMLIQLTLITCMSIQLIGFLCFNWALSTDELLSSGDFNAILGMIVPFFPYSIFKLIEFSGNWDVIFSFKQALFSLPTMMGRKVRMAFPLTCIHSFQVQKVKNGSRHRLILVIQKPNTTNLDYEPVMESKDRNKVEWHANWIANRLGVSLVTGQQ